MNGLFGRQSGTTPGYSYSAANKNMAVIWEEKTLYDYLLNPKKVCVDSLYRSGSIFDSGFPFKYSLCQSFICCIVFQGLDTGV